MNKKANIGITILILICITLVICILLFGVVYGIKYIFTSGEETITVDYKWTKIVDGTERYRVTSTDGQVFVIADSIVNIQFESATLYSIIKDGRTYKIKTQGFRFGFFSDFKNIVELTEIDTMEVQNGK